MKNLFQRITGFIRTLSSNPIFYWSLLFITAAVCLAQAVFYAHQQPSQLDEGAFMIKGYYYITGKYAPFQENGFLTNKMPLSFLIPGLAQAVFGTGLMTGRYFAIALLFLSLAPIWSVLTRLKGKWWALLGMAAVAFNPTLIMTYVKANSQVVAAGFLAWSLFFLLGEERKPWQMAVGASLSALMVLTRQNMVFALPFVVVYAFWQHGKQAGWAALAGAAIPLLFAHIIYYPGIIWIWMEWAPSFIRQLFNYKIVEGGGSSLWNPDYDPLARVSSFFMTTRYHFFSLMGVLLAICMLPAKRIWKNEFERRMVFMLSVMFLFLFAIHAWAALGKNYCVFCFPVYVSFFLLAGLVITIITLSTFIEKRAQPNTALVISVLLVITPSIFLGSLDTVGRWILDFPAPRFKGGRILFGLTELGTLFENRFQMEYEQLIVTVPLFFGFVVAILLVGVLWVVYRFAAHRNINLGHFMVASFFFLSLVFTPTPLLGKSVNENTCGADIIAAYESAGRYLAEIVPPGAKVFWRAGSEVTPLVYLTHAELHPPQLNGIYSYRKGGDRDLLEKGGFYNEESIQYWRDTDDFFLISGRYFTESWRSQMESPEFLDHGSTPPVNPCFPDSAIRIFERMQR